MGLRGGLTAILIVSGCGRIGFVPEAGSDGVGGDAVAAGDAVTAGDGDGSSGIQWVGAFVANDHVASTKTDMFTAQAAHPGDAILLNVYCLTTATPTSVAISGGGVSWYAISGLVSATSEDDYAESFGLIAPDTVQRTFTVTWSGTSSCQYLSEIGDEFANIDDTGGAVTFDAHAEAFAAGGNCSVTVATANDDDAVWAVCQGNIIGVGAGYTEGAQDATEFSEYRVTTDLKGTPETPTVQGHADWVMGAVTIKPR